MGTSRTPGIRVEVLPLAPPGRAAIPSTVRTALVADWSGNPGDGNAVTTWPDVEPGRPAAVAQGAPIVWREAAVNGFPALEFPALSDAALRLFFDTAYDFEALTLVAVVQLDELAPDPNPGAALDGWDGSTRALLRADNPANSPFWRMQRANNSTVSEAGPYTKGEPHVIVAYFAGPSSFFRINGQRYVLDENIGWQQLPGITIGNTFGASNQALAGWVAEVYTAPGDLTADPEFESFEQSLLNRYRTEQGGWVDVTGRLRAADISRGKDHPLNQTTVATANLTVDNNDGFFIPGDEFPGRPVRVYGGAQLLFTGTVQRYRFERAFREGDRRAVLFCQDAVRYMHDWRQPLSEDPIGEGDTPGERFERILDLIEATEGVVFPRSIDPGNGTMTATRGTEAAGVELDDAAIADAGQWGVLADGTIRFISRDTLLDPNYIDGAPIIGENTDRPIIRGALDYGAERVLNDVRLSRRYPGVGPPSVEQQVRDTQSIQLVGVRALVYTDLAVQSDAQALATAQAFIAFYSTPDLDDDTIDIPVHRGGWVDTFAQFDLFDPVIVSERNRFRTSIVYGLRYRWEARTGWSMSMNLYAYNPQSLPDDTFVLDDPDNGVLDVNVLAPGFFRELAPNAP